MSDPRSKALRSKTKDIRQGLPQREVIHGKKKVVAKPFQVERRYPFHLTNDWFFHLDWRKERRFATRELAESYIEKELRSVNRVFKPEHHPEFRVIEAPKPVDASKERTGHHGPF